MRSLFSWEAWFPAAVSYPTVGACDCSAPGTTRACRTQVGSPGFLCPRPYSPSLLPGRARVSQPTPSPRLPPERTTTRPSFRTLSLGHSGRRGSPPAPGPSPLTPSPVVAAAARSGPQAPRRSAPGPPPPRTSARPPATAAAEEAAAAVVAAPPPRPPEPPTRTSPNRGRGRFVTQAGPGPDGPPRPLPSPAPPRRAPSSPPRPGAAASRPPLLRWLSQPSNPGPGSGPASCGDPGSGPSRTSRAGPAASFAPCPATTGRHERRAVPHRI